MHNSEKHCGTPGRDTEAEPGEAGFCPVQLQISYSVTGQERLAKRLLKTCWKRHHQSQKTPSDPVLSVLSNTTFSEDNGLPCENQSLHGIVTSIHQCIPKRIKREILLSSLIFSSSGREMDAETSILAGLRYYCCLKRSLFLSPPQQNSARGG